MALYIDGRFAISGQESHINLQNPVNVTKEIRKEITSAISELPEPVESPTILTFNTEDPSDPTIFFVATSITQGKTIDSLTVSTFNPMADGYAEYIIKVVGEGAVTVAQVFCNQDQLVANVIMSLNHTFQSGEYLTIELNNQESVTLPQGFQITLKLI